MAERRARILTPEDIAPKAEAEGHIARKIQERRDQFVATTTPSFPRALMMEISNICNHACEFCAISGMYRPKQLMPPELFRDTVAQAHALGVREAALGGGAEPLACKHLEDYVAFCKDTGYDYVYITTNGSIADAERWRRLIAERESRGNLSGLLCEDCLYGDGSPYQPMNGELG